MKLDIYITNMADYCKGGEHRRNAYAALGQLDLDIAEPLELQIEGKRLAPESWVYVQTIEVDETLIAARMADLEQGENAA